MSLVPKEHSIAANRNMLSEITVIGWEQSQGEVQKSGVLSNHAPELQYTEELLWNFSQMTKKK